MTTTVTTQTELDAATAAGETTIYIESPAGIWLNVNTPSTSRVVAWGSSRVVARDSSSVEARDSSRVVARDSSSVEARDSSSVEARDSSRVEARDTSSVEAGRYVAVHLHSARATVAGGVVIDVSALDRDDPAVWADLVGLRPGATEGWVRAYKAVDSTLMAGQGHVPTRYPIGETVEAADWRDDTRCGAGLHFSPAPSAARRYYQGEGDPRFLAVEVELSGIRPLGSDKCKARTCRVLGEVDVHGDEITAAVTA